MANDMYRELQKRLDMYSLGFPATKSGIEIDILKKLFTEDDVTVFMAMSPRLEEPAAVADRLGRPADETAGRMEDMSSRGLLFRVRKDEKVKYAAIPFMHGLAEFQVSRIDRGFSEMLERYFDEGLHGAIASSEGLFMRTIPVQKSVTPEHHVASFEDACAIVKKADIIAVADCLCRKARKSVGKGCGKPMEACFMFGSMAKYYIDYGMGRQIDADEAVRIIAAAQDAGLVTQPATAQNPTGMCNCCGDCCGVLGAIKTHPRPAEIVFSNYQALVEAVDCTGCEACLDRCQMDAIAMNADGVAWVNPARCIGCGLCVTACTAGAMTLMVKPEGLYKTPPSNGAEQMLNLAKKRGVL